MRWRSVVQLRHGARLGHRRLNAPRRTAVRRSLGVESGGRVTFRSPAPRARQGQQASLPSAGPGVRSTAGAARSLFRRAVRLAERTFAGSPHDRCRIAFLVPSSSSHHQRSARQSPSVSTYVCLRHGARRRQPACAHAVDGSCRYPDHTAVCAGHSPRRLPAVCPSRGPAHSPASEDCLVSARRPPLSHPLAPVLDRAVDSLSAALNPETTRHYRGTVRKFLTYLGAAHPQVSSLDQLRRDPHLLGWMSCLRSQTPPLATASCSNLLIHLRSILQELAGTQPFAELAHLIRPLDIPRLPKRLPRSLTAQQDQLLDQELLRRNDLGGEAFLVF